MAGIDSNRELISKILQESDDEEEDELDRIIYANIRKSGKGTDGKIQSEMLRQPLFYKQIQRSLHRKSSGERGFSI